MTDGVEMHSFKQADGSAATCNQVSLLGDVDVVIEC